MLYQNVIWNKVVYLTGNVFPPEKVEAIIEAAQLPIAPFGADEVKAVWGNGSEYFDKQHLVLDVANRVVSRRNSPPQTEQVDPLEQNIDNILMKNGVAMRGLAKKVAAAVRQEG